MAILIHTLAILCADFNVRVPHHLKVLHIKTFKFNIDCISDSIPIMVGCQMCIATTWVHKSPNCFYIIARLIGTKIHINIEHKNSSILYKKLAHRRTVKWVENQIQCHDFLYAIGFTIGYFQIAITFYVSRATKVYQGFHIYYRYAFSGISLASVNLASKHLSLTSSFQ